MNSLKVGNTLSVQVWVLVETNSTDKLVSLDNGGVVEIYLNDDGEEDSWNIYYQPSVDEEGKILLFSGETEEEAKEVFSRIRLQLLRY